MEGDIEGRGEEKETRLLVFRRRRKNDDHIHAGHEPPPPPLARARTIRRRRRRLPTDKIEIPRRCCYWLLLIFAEKTVLTRSDQARQEPQERGSPHDTDRAFTFDTGGRDCRRPFCRPFLYVFVPDAGDSTVFK